MELAGREGRYSKTEYSMEQRSSVQLAPLPNPTRPLGVIKCAIDRILSCDRNKGRTTLTRTSDCCQYKNNVPERGSVIDIHISIDSNYASPVHWATAGTVRCSG